MGERSRFTNALIGAAVTIGLAFVPLSSVVGGGVAGYLDGGDLGDGFRVGALSGLLATVPVLVMFAFVGTILSAGLLGLGARRLLAFGSAFVLAAVLFSIVYLVGLSSLGGAVGAAIGGGSDGDPGVGD